jgi:hypothetical protein
MMGALEPLKMVMMIDYGMLEEGEMSRRGAAKSF